MMAGNVINVDEQENASRFQKIGLVLAVMFYVVAVVMVALNQFGGGLSDIDAKTLTFAHWQLEDGFREGIAQAIKSYEALKLEQGIKVRVVQTAIPNRAYKQWQMTQLVSGKPADIIELMVGSDLRNQYFTPLSPYIGAPNPYNRGTVLENVPWSDTFVDDMQSALDEAYAEYFGVGPHLFTFRMYVNLDLLHRATGSDRLPQDLPEWLEMCGKIKELGVKDGIPYIPIGVRGFDRGTIGQLAGHYINQMTANWNDEISRYELTALPLDQIRALKAKKISREQLLAGVGVLLELGANFGEGFSATDLEQTKFLFSSGRVAFFPEGTWNAFSIINNAKGRFRVAIIDVPPVGNKHRYSKYFLGLPSEQGAGVGALFGIPKACPNFDLALDFLHYITSYKVNRMIMVDNAHWLSSLKNVEYTDEIMKAIEPVKGAGYISISSMLSVSSKDVFRRGIESCIINGTRDWQKQIWENYLGDVDNNLRSTNEILLGERRNLNNIESLRTFAAFGAMVAADEQEHKRLHSQALMNFENLPGRVRSIRVNEDLLKELPTIKEIR